MTIDPRLTIVRTRQVGVDFYDSVMKRINARQDGASGVMFHFSGTHGDEFFAVSAYRKPENAMSMFSEHTAPELLHEISEGGGGPDISRDEFAITRYVIRDDEDLQGYRITEPGEFVAVLLTNDAISRERYVKTTKHIGFPEDWPEGLIIHVAGMFGNHWGVFDVWHADADMSAFYAARLAPALTELYSEQDGNDVIKPEAIVLHSLYIDRGTFESRREYLREE